MRYIPLEEQLHSAELGTYQSFGIKAMERRGDAWRVVAQISDVSVDLDFVAELCQRCNEGDLSPLHLLDVVEDAL